MEDQQVIEQKVIRVQLERWKCNVPNCCGFKTYDAPRWTTRHTGRHTGIRFVVSPVCKWVKVEIQKYLHLVRPKTFRLTPELLDKLNKLFFDYSFVNAVQYLRNDSRYNACILDSSAPKPRFSLSANNTI